jgi:hypothetical protein
MDESKRRPAPAIGRTRSRRRFMFDALAACGAVAVIGRGAAATLLSAPKRSATVTIENFSAAGVSLGASNCHGFQNRGRVAQATVALAYHVT